MLQWLKNHANMFFNKFSFLKNISSALISEFQEHDSNLKN